MKACYGVLGILYGKDEAGKLQSGVYRNAYKAADKWADAHTDVRDQRIKQFADAAKASNETPPPSDKEIHRRADGAQKMYWLDQNHPQANHEIKEGQLGTELQNVPGYTSNTHIWALKPGS